MNTKTLNVFAAVTVFLMAATTVRAQSYSNTVLSLNPVGYWPMHEVEAAAQGDIETNYGSLGVLGNAYYPDWTVNNGAFIRQMPGALASDPNTALFFTEPVNNNGGATNGLYVPHTSPLATLNPPFTIDYWFMVTNPPSGNAFQGDMVSQADGSKTKGIRIYYQDNLVGNVTAILYDGVQSSLAVTTLSATNQWHYVAVSCDAHTNFTFFFEGQQFGSVFVGVGKYTPDLNEPFEVGQGLANQRGWNGGIDEVAVYNTNLSAARITAHYQDGTNTAVSAGQYFNDVTGDNALIYLRMDGPTYSAPAVGTWPALVNCGKTNGTTVGNGVYTPGTVPSLVAGTSYINFPLNLGSMNVAHLSGVSSLADAGYAAAYNPAGTTPFTVSAIFRGNATDTNRIQSIVGHGTNSWELGMGMGGRIVFNSGTNDTAPVATGIGAGDLVSTKSYSDGNWHEVVAVHNGTTNMLYVDGVANNTNVVGANNVGNSMDVMIGSDPCYTYNPPLYPPSLYMTNVGPANGLGEQFAGQICDIAFFTNVLTAAQVTTLYNLSGVPPSIAQQPVSAEVSAGVAFTNMVTIAGGSNPIFYQWYTNGVALGAAANRPLGGTNLMFVLNPALGGDNCTNYYVVVSNFVASATSSVVRLQVDTTPVIVQNNPITYTNPATLTLYGGANVGGTNFVGSTPNFSVVVLGGSPLTYQWTTNNVAMGGATNASFTITNCQVSSPTNIDCIVTNIYGSVTSTVWSVSYLPAPMATFPQAVLAAQPVGYWRLNEPDDGVFDGDAGLLCHDYESGNNGIYTNVILGNTGYSPTTDPDEVAAQFGAWTATFSDANSISSNIDFSASANATFTVAIWANGNGAATRNGNAGLVTKGFNNFEEYLIDEGGAGSTLRFGVRVGIVGNAFFGANGISLANNSTWHYVVGVCDEPHTNVAIYVDGLLRAKTLVPLNDGIIQSSSSTPLRIGDRGPITAPGNSQFKGNLNDAAIYNYVLSPGQIASQYDAGGGTIAPYFFPSAPSTNASAGANTTLTISVTAIGTPPIGYVWTNVTAGGVVATGVTNGTSLNTTLNYANVPASWNTNLLELIVTNAYGVTSNFFRLSITNVVNSIPTNIVFSVTGGNQLTLSWPADHTGWRLQSQTNSITVGIRTNWVDVSGSTTTNQVLVPINPTNGSVFYRMIYP
jgi:prepilin-type processing-associated H-X9-DG protein